MNGHSGFVTFSDVRDARVALNVKCLGCQPTREVWRLFFCGGNPGMNVMSYTATN